MNGAEAAALSPGDEVVILRLQDDDDPTKDLKVEDGELAPGIVGTVIGFDGFYVNIKTSHSSTSWPMLPTELALFRKKS